MCDLQGLYPTCISMQTVTESGRKKGLCALKLKLCVYGGYTSQYVCFLNLSTQS